MPGMLRKLIFFFVPVRERGVASFFLFCCLCEELAEKNEKLERGHAGSGRRQLATSPSLAAILGPGCEGDRRG
jgi:hypothetical protein